MNVKQYVHKYSILDAKVKYNLQLITSLSTKHIEIDKFLRSHDINGLESIFFLDDEMSAIIDNLKISSLKAYCNQVAVILHEYNTTFNTYVEKNKIIFEPINQLQNDLSNFKRIISENNDNHDSYTLITRSLSKGENDSLLAAQERKAMKDNQRQNTKHIENKIETVVTSQIESLYYEYESFNKELDDYIKSQSACYQYQLIDGFNQLKLKLDKISRLENDQDDVIEYDLIWRKHDALSSKITSIFEDYIFPEKVKNVSRHIPVVAARALTLHLGRKHTKIAKLIIDEFKNETSNNLDTILSIKSKWSVILKNLSSNLVNCTYTINSTGSFAKRINYICRKLNIGEINFSKYKNQKLQNLVKLNYLSTKTTRKTNNKIRLKNDLVNSRYTIR